MEVYRYYDEDDGLVIPELYFQAKFPDLNYTTLSNLSKQDCLLNFEKFKVIVNKYFPDFEFEMLCESYQMNMHKQYLIVKDKLGEQLPIVFQVQSGPAPTRKTELAIAKAEEVDFEDFVSIDEHTEIFYLYCVLSEPVMKGKLKEFIDEMYSSFIKPEIDEASFVYTLGSDARGPKLDSHYLTLKTYGSNIIEENYNDDFKEVYQKTFEFLEEDGLSGLILLDGLPGTGKTSIIKHFISIGSKLEKKLVVVPSAFASVLSEPSFLSFAATSLQDSILILEDAETALGSRDGSNNPSVSNILNLSNGILGDVLSVKIVATLNTKDNIDKALLRPGRLVASYSFGKLVKDKAKKLFENLGGNPSEIEEDTVLAELYNRSPNKFGKQEKTQIGFRSNTTPNEPTQAKIGGFGRK